MAWDFDYGQPFDKPTRNEVFASCQPDYIAGLSLLGGEPMEPENQRELLPFVRNFKALYPNKTVWCYSGYTWEQLTGKEPSLARCEATDELLSLLDVLVDGEFVEAKHDISLRFRGSSNQRLLDVKRPLPPVSPCGGRTKRCSPPILWKNKHNRKERPVFHFLNGTCGKLDAFFLFYSLLPTASSMMRRKALP